jgi:protein-S-isoprenylcysteine O-methyltransferase Ste14
MTLENIRTWAFRMRGGIWTVMAISLLLVGRGGEGLIGVGLVLVILGQAVRFWAAGTIQGYRRETVNAEKLVTWGPFAIVRNPLYLGNGLIGLGWSFLAGYGSIPVFCVAFLVLYGFLIIPHEETFLKARFGKEYLDYMAGTPKLVPTRIPGLERLRGSFETARLWKSERHSVYVTVAGTVVFILKAKGWL